MKIYEVGGAVRDSLLGVASKDVDFSVELTAEECEQHPGLRPFGVMCGKLLSEGFKIYQENEEFLTIRAQAPKGWTFGGRPVVGGVDFVLCRKDSATGDGRRPDSVTPGTILDDLARRDFTVNAIARDMDGTLIDPHNGQEDLKNGVLRFVGDPMTRIREDGLRVMRALRFWVTKKLLFTKSTRLALQHADSSEMLKKVSVERIREELEKMLAHDTIITLYLLAQFPVGNSIFRDGLRLSATLKR
jgi:tRNA nucleotidyltransferase (CCA-adding enzyme)